MTVPASILKKGPYLIDGETGPFDYDWRIYDAAHLRVVVKNADDTEVELVYSTDYSVSGVDDENGGFITINTAGTTDQELWITPNFPEEQIENFSNQRAPFTTSVEDALDKQMVVVKQIGEKLDRAVVVPISSDQNPDDVIGNIEQGVIDAETAAANAATSETNAAISAADAAASEAATVGAAEDIQVIVDTFPGKLIDRFDGDGITTDFTLSYEPLTPTAVDVHIKNDATGDWQDPTVDYTVLGTTLSFVVPPVAGTGNIVAAITPLTAHMIPADGSVTQIKLAPDVLIGASPDSVGMDELKHGVGGEIQSWNAAGAPETIPNDGAIGSVLTSNGAGIKPSWQLQGEAAAGTVLLIHSDTFDGDTTFVDSSPSAHTITTGGTPIHSTARSKFGASSIRTYDNPAEYLRVSSSPDLNFGTGDFVIEGWFNFETDVDYPPTPVYFGGIFSLPEGDPSHLGLLVNDSHFTFFVNGSGINHNTAPEINTWYHFALIRSGNVVRAFLGGAEVGVEIDVTGVSFSSQGDETRIGAWSSVPINGYIDEFSIVKGSDKGWFNGFTPPTAPYTTPGQGTLPPPPDDSVGMEQMKHAPAGSLISYQGDTTPYYLLIGANGTVPTSNGTTIEWAAPASGVTDHVLLSNIGTNTHAELDTHIADTTGNPHQVNAAQVGLGNVPNLAAADMPVSDDTQTALDLKANTVHNHAGDATLYTAPQGYIETTLADAVNIVWDVNANPAASVILTDNRTLDNPLNMQEGTTYQLNIYQDATGGRTLAFSNKYVFVDDADVILTTDANKYNLLTCRCENSPVGLIMNAVLEDARTLPSL